MDATGSQSYLSGVKDFPLVSTTIPALLDQKATLLQDKPAHIFRNLSCSYNGNKSINDSIKLDRIVVTYRNMAERSLRVAGALLDIGLTSGDRVAVLGNNSPEWLYLDYACLRIKVLMIRVPASLIHHDAIIQILQKYECKVFFLDRDEIASKIHNIIPGLLTGTLSEDDTTSLKDLKIMFLRAPDYGDHWTTVSSLMAYDGDLDPVKTIQQTLDPDGIAVVFPTSGSTGFPKFATYSHAKIINGSNVAMTGFDPDNRGYAIVCTDRPMAWIGGLHYASTSAGYTFVQVDQHISLVDLIFQIMHEEQTTGFAVMAYVLYDAMKGLQEGRLVIPASLENIITGGERLSHNLMKFVNESFKSAFIYYGLTEGYHSFKNKPTSEDGIYITEVMPHTELKVIDDAGNVIPRGSTGHLRVRSAITMIGYLDDPESSNRILHPSGWLHTEDIAVISESGCIEIVGRTRDIISSGGIKCYPRTIEMVLIKFHKVENVIVIGVPDVRLFQVVCACVLPKQGEQITEKELSDFYSANMLGSVTTTPKYIWIVSELPKGCSGKFDRLKLVEMAVKHFNLN